jgi:hypothetical protein
VPAAASAAAGAPGQLTAPQHPLQQQPGAQAMAPKHQQQQRGVATAAAGSASAGGGRSDDRP